MSNYEVQYLMENGTQGSTLIYAKSQKDAEEFFKQNMAYLNATIVSVEKRTIFDYDFLGD